MPKKETRADLKISGKRGASKSQLTKIERLIACDDNRPELIAKDFQTFLSLLKPVETRPIRIATLQFADGTSCRRQADSNTFSKTRNAVVPIESLTKGEVIEEFGEIQKLLSIVITDETY